MTILGCLWRIAVDTNRGDFYSKQAGGYYAMLAEAFGSGQTHLKVEPHPDLQKLADPFLQGRELPRLHDATYYNGRYYLYFGPAPAVVLFLPWQWLTGTFLFDGAASCFFTCVGFLAGALLLWLIWRRWFADLPSVWLGWAVLIWGGGNYAIILSTSGMFYAVPILGAYAFVTSAVLCLWLALEAGSWPGACRWYLVGVILWAVAIGCRANYVYSLPALAAYSLVLWRVARNRWPTVTRPLLRLFLLGAAPIAAVGLTLAAYNFVRFGNVAEFGVRYQFAGSDQRQMKFFDWAEFPRNAHYYWGQFPRLLTHFPFVAKVDGQTTYGWSGCAPIALLGLLHGVGLWLPRLRRDWAWWGLGLTLLGASALNWVSLLGLPFANERYFADFIPLATMAGLMAGWMLVAWIRHCQAGAVARALVTGVLVGSFGWTLVLAAVFVFSRYGDEQKLAPVARIATEISSRLENLFSLEHGSVRFEVVFPEKSGGSPEPLVVSSLGGDQLFVEYLPSNCIRFGFCHRGNDWIYSEKMPIVPGRKCDLEVDLGCLYPPKGHPWLRSWPQDRVDRLRQIVRVSLDGREVFRDNSFFYDTDPRGVYFGKNKFGGITAPEFTGSLKVQGSRWLPKPEILAIRRETGPLRLTLNIPPFTGFRREPLVSTGPKGRGDVCYVTYLAPGKLRFGHDSWGGGGAVESEVVSYNASVPQVVDIWMGSLGTQQEMRPDGVGLNAVSPLLMRFNGELVLMENRATNPSTPEQLAIGFNAASSGYVRESFSGHVLRFETIEIFHAQGAEGTGPVRMTVIFPTGHHGVCEPLLTTGKTGAADVVFVEYMDDRHVRIGHDHWGVGASWSEPVEIDYEARHTINISMGSLYPSLYDQPRVNLSAAPHHEQRAGVSVSMNGVPLLLSAPQAYPATAGQVFPGSNPVGASSCREQFSGAIKIIERLGP